jgi:hypothetical protein
MTTSTERLLIPIGRNLRSGGAIHYALRRHAMGRPVEVCLLHVKESPGHWELLFNLGRSEAHFERRTEDAMTKAALPLRQQEIPYAAYLRSGAVVFSILDAAEELDCSEIVVPMPRTGWGRLFSREVVKTLLVRQRFAAVITVTGEGQPMRPPKLT